MLVEERLLKKESGQRREALAAIMWTCDCPLMIAAAASGLPGGRTEAIFRSFYTTKKQGLGLALSISRSIIAAHHGSVWCEALEEGGTVVHVELHDYPFVTT